MSEMTAEVSDLGKTVEEMSIGMVNCQQILKREEDEDIIKQANNILEKNQVSEEFVDTIRTVKDEVNTSRSTADDADDTVTVSLFIPCSLSLSSLSNDPAILTSHAF